MLSHIVAIVGPSVVNRESLHILVWSGHAVFAFFIISGFYMSLIINENYAKLPDGIRRFYLNRALRLYPVHWTVLALFAVDHALSGTPSFLIGNDMVPMWRWLYAMFSNIFLFGTEVLPTMDVANQTFVKGPLWSLSIECYFYLLAPFVVGRSLRTVVALFAAALVFRLSLYIAGASLVPWRYFFFPADLALFLLGSLSYRLFAWLDGKSVNRPFGVLAAVLICAYLTWPRLWTAPDLDQPLSWCFFVFVALSTPSLFALTRNSSFDNMLGQLSYPIYLSHTLVIGIVARTNILPMDKGLLATILTLALSVGLYVSVDRPIEHIRQRVKAAKG